MNLKELPEAYLLLNQKRTRLLNKIEVYLRTIES